MRSAPLEKNPKVGINPCLIASLLASLLISALGGYAIFTAYHPDNLSQTADPSAAYGIAFLFLLTGLLSALTAFFAIQLNDRLKKASIVDDVRSQEKSNASAAKINLQQQIINSTQDFILIADATGTIIESNSWATHSLNTASTIPLIDGQFADKAWGTFFAQLKEQGTHTCETYFRAKDGATIHVEALYQYVDSEESTQVYCIARDLTVLKKAHEQLLVTKTQVEGLNSKLHKLVGRSGKLSLRTQNQKEINRELITTVSHDMKRSLTQVMNMLDYLYKTAFGDTQQVFSQNAYSMALSLRNTIKNLLDTVQLENEELIIDRTTFTMKQIVDKVDSQLSPLAKDKRIKLHTLIAPPILHVLRGDPERLERILFNLLSNALELNQTGQIFLRIKLLDIEHDSAFVEITIKDHENEDADKKSKATDNDENSVFIRNSHELTLRNNVSRSLIEHMGGKIWQRQGPGTRTTYFFTLHLGVETLNTDLPVSGSSSASDSPLQDLDESLQILVSESSFVSQQTLKLQIRSAGHQFTIVRSGNATVDRLKDRNFDVLLIDLTQLEGLQTLKKLHNALSPAKRKSLYIIAMIAVPPEDVQHLAEKLNIQDFISKPVLEEDLVFALKCAIAIKEDSAEKLATEAASSKLNYSSEAPSRISGSENDRFQPNFGQAESPLSDDEINALLSLTGGSPEKSTDASPQKKKQPSKPHDLANQAVIELKKNFVETTPHLIDQIKDALEKEDHQLISSTAAAIKASTYYFEAQELESVADSVKALANNQAFNEILSLITDMENAFLKAVERLELDE